MRHTPFSNRVGSPSPRKAFLGSAFACKAHGRRRYGNVIRNRRKNIKEGVSRVLSKHEAHKTLYKFIKKGISIVELEQWLYKYDELETILGQKDYLEFISRNFKDKFASDETEKQIRKMIDIGFFEEDRIKELLKELIYSRNSERTLEILQILYDEYCNGYSFLRFLGLYFVTTSEEYQDELIRNEQDYERYIEPVIKEAKRLINFFERQEIKINEEYNYIDNRQKEDRIELTSIEQMFNKH
jgi:hypothetical protein